LALTADNTKQRSEVLIPYGCHARWLRQPVTPVTG